MAKLAALCAAVFACLAVLPASANAATSQVVPPYFTVSPLSVNGSGCPPNSAAVSQASDNTFTITYSQYQAEAGQGAPIGAFRRNCQINVRVGVPQGWTFGITEVDYRGYAHMGYGARGLLTASYYFAGLPATLYQRHELRGYRDGDYEFSDRAAVLAWAPCHFNTTLNVNTALQAYQATDPSDVTLMTVDSTDVNMSTVYHLGFRRC